MTTRIGRAYIEVSAEFMAEGGAVWRRAVRDALRQALSDLGPVLKMDHFTVDPFERRGILDAPMRRHDNIHIIGVRGRIKALAEATSKT